MRLPSLHSFSPALGMDEKCCGGVAESLSCCALFRSSSSDAVLLSISSGVACVGSSSSLGFFAFSS